MRTQQILSSPTTGRHELPRTRFAAIALAALLTATTWPTPSAEAAAAGGRIQNPLPDGAVTSRFGGRVNPFSQNQEHHDGIDVAAAAGSPIFAPAAGTVTRAEVIDSDAPHLGTIIELEHGDGLSTFFAHLGKLRVRTGDIVARGDAIALVGMSGQSTGPHIHFEVREGGELIDPGSLVPEWQAGDE